MKRPYIAGLSWFFFSATLALAAYPGFSQAASRPSKPVVILTALTSPTGDTVAGTLASTITSSIDLMLKLAGSVDLKRADFLIPTTSLARTIPYYDQHNAKEAVFGSITPTADGAYTIEFDVWNASNSNGNPTVIRGTISNVLSSFNFADEISLKVASTVVGRKLEQGTLIIQNVSNLPKFSVYANGHLLGRNRTTLGILTGNWKIVVAKPGEVGDIPVQAFNVDIQQGETAIIALSQAAPASTSVATKPVLTKKTKSASSVKPHAGNVMVTSKQAGSVFVDNKKIGAIAAGGHLWLPQLLPGKHTVQLVFDNGSTQVKRVSITSDVPETLSFEARVFSPSPIKPASNGYWPVQFDKVQFPRSSGRRLWLTLLSYPNVPVKLHNAIKVDEMTYEKALTAGYWTDGLLGGGGVLLGLGIVAGIAGATSGGSNSAAVPGIVMAVTGAGLLFGAIVPSTMKSGYETKALTKTIHDWNTYASASP